MILVTHLWQSTLCAGVAALLGLGLRRAPARTRHAIWLCASMKFLISFSLFVTAGNYLGAWTPSISTPAMSTAARWLDRSWSLWSVNAASVSASAGAPVFEGVGLVALTLIWASGVAVLGMWRWREWRSLSRLAATATRLDSGREADALQHIARTSRERRPIDLIQCESTIEPGVLGSIRPQLLWPVGLSDRLTDDELEMILSHEACHVDRRDNMTGLLHMVVEIVFWFHPVVWWIGARLISERERACDEAVLQLGADRTSYAEGILKVCGFYLRSPNAFVAGVGGSRLTRRIEWILTRPSASLTPAMRLSLAAVLAVMVGAPFATGITSAATSPLETRGNVAENQQAKGKIYLPHDEGVTMPKLIYDRRPGYTAEAMRARIQGDVQLEAVILPSGEVGDVKVIKSLDTEYGLDAASVATLKQWRFEPGRKDKKAVAVRIEVEMTFRLK